MQISVIIPVYNSAATIGAALDSVVVQQHDVLELIVVDDCSGDDTAAVTRDWDTHRNYARIPLRLLRTPRNGGPAAARNLGIQNALGDWIAFLDADDEWLPGKLEAQLTVIKTFREENQGATPALICGATEAYDSLTSTGTTGTTGSTGSTGATGMTETPEMPTPPVRRLVLEEFAVANPVATSTVLVRRDVLLAVGGFDEQFRGPEDYDLWMRVAADRRETEDGRPQTADCRPQTEDCRPQTEDGRLKTEMQARGRAVLLKLERPLVRYRAVPGSLSLDDRRFLPQVLRVLDKAYGPAGALSGMPERRATSESAQYWSASWMAFQRGDRRVAITHWVKAWRLNRRSPYPVERRWMPLLLRYVGGKS